MGFEEEKKSNNVLFVHSVYYSSAVGIQYDRGI